MLCQHWGETVFAGQAAPEMSEEVPTVQFHQPLVELHVPQELQNHLRLVPPTL